MEPVPTATDTCTNDDEEGEPASEDVNCVKNPDNLDGNGGKSPNVSNDEEGYAIRQLSGPTLLDTTSPRADGRGGDGDVTADGFDDDGDGGVGDTGGGPTLSGHRWRCRADPAGCSRDARRSAVAPPALLIPTT